MTFDPSAPIQDIGLAARERRRADNARVCRGIFGFLIGCLIAGGIAAWVM